MGQELDGEEHSGGSRRSFLTKLGIGAAAAWTVPVVLSSPASAGPGTDVCLSCGQLVAGGTGTAADLASWTLVNGPVSLNNEFRGGSSGASAARTMTQVINLTGDCGGTAAVLSARLRGNQSGNASTVVATWFADPNATGTNLGTMNVSSTNTTFTTFTDNDLVPNGAQSVQVVITMFQGGNTTNSGGSDDITLTLC